MSMLSSFWEREKKNFPLGVQMVIFAIAFEYFAWGLSDAYYSTLLKNIFDHVFLIGVILATFHFAVLISVLFLPPLLEKMSPRKILFLGKIFIITSFVGMFLAAYFESLPAFFIVSIINAFGAACREVGTREYLLQHCNQENASTILGTASAVRDGIYALSLMLSGFLLFAFSKIIESDILSVIHIAYLFALPVGVCTFFFLKKIPETKEETSSLSCISHKHHTSFFRIFREVPLVAKFSIFLMGFLQIILVSTTLFLPLLALELDLSIVNIGFLMGAMTFPLFLATLFSVFEDRFDRMLFNVGGLLLSTVPLFLLVAVDAPFFIALLSMLISLSVAIIRPASLGIIASHISHEDAPAAATLQIFANRVGAFTGAFGISMIANTFGIRISFLVIGILAVCFALVALSLEWNIRKKPFHGDHPFKIHPLHPKVMHLHHHS